MKKSLCVGALACAAFVSTPAAAGGLAMEANGARAQSVWGGEFGVGYAFQALGFSLRPMVGAFVYQGDNDRYFNDDLGNGQTRCRDTTNGQFAAKKMCDSTAVKPYGRVEATYAIPLFAEVGAGARFSSDKVRPYGTVAFSLVPNPVGPSIKLKANAGPKYGALGIAVGF